MLLYIFCGEVDASTSCLSHLSFAEVELPLSIPSAKDLSQSLGCNGLARLRGVECLSWCDGSSRGFLPLKKVSHDHASISMVCGEVDASTFCLSHLSFAGVELRNVR